MVSQLINHAITPLSGSNLAADDAPNLPIQVNEFGVDGLVGALAGSFDKLNNVAKY